MVKFVTEYAPPEERVITPVDRGLLELKDAVANMHTQVDAVQARIDQYVFYHSGHGQRYTNISHSLLLSEPRCTKHASEALAKDRKAHALSYIRSRKQLQEVLSKRLGSLATLESTLITVEAAAGDVEVCITSFHFLSAMKSLTATTL